MAILYKTQYQMEGSNEWQSREDHLPVPIFDAMEVIRHMIAHPKIARIRLVNGKGEVKVEVNKADAYF